MGTLHVGARRYAYGSYMLALQVLACLPSQRVRRWALVVVGRLKIDKTAVFYAGCKFRAPHRIYIGRGSSIGDGVVLDGRGGLSIGENVNVSSEAMIWTAEHQLADPHFKSQLAPVYIESFAWIGPRAIIMPGVTIAEGCVIAAGAVVTRNTEPYGFYAGVPAVRKAERPRNLDYGPSKDYIPFI